MVSATRKQSLRQAQPEPPSQSPSVIGMTNAPRGSHKPLSIRDVGDGPSSLGESESMDIDDHAEIPSGNANGTGGEDVARIDSLGVDVKDALDTINSLQDLGLQKFQIQLPKCIVLGDQSAGKSSVIEAISGIKTPRADGTCTRCPLYITMQPSKDDKWSARVSLRCDFSYDGNKSTRSRARRFPGWVESSRTNNIAFAATNNRGELEEIIRRAHLAILSPMVNYQEFLEPSIAHLANVPKADFSPNVVCITVSQPGLPSLSFYDLPGVFDQAEDDAKGYLVKFVQDIVTSYVEDADALILLCCPLDTDIANSSAARIARQKKAANRCIGVLTKADRLPVGSQYDRFQQVFDGKTFALGHGYFAVKNLNQHEIKQGLTHGHAREMEEKFFKTTSPWSDFLADHADRFGTPKLQRFLSSKLATQIIDKLPIMQGEIIVRLQAVEDKLKLYPEPPRNAVTTVTDIVRSFSKNVRKQLRAEYPCKEWRGEWEALQKAFFVALMSMKPTLTVSGTKDKGIYSKKLSPPGNGFDDDPFVIDSDEAPEDEGQTTSSTSTPNKKRKAAATVTPTQSPLSKTPTSYRKPPPTANTSTGSASPSKLVPPDFSEHRLRFHLDSVSRQLKETSKTLLPEMIEPRVIYSMMLETLRHWEKPLDVFLDTLERQMKTQFENLFFKHFEKWQGSALYTNAWAIVLNMLEVNFYQQRTIMASESLEAESEGPYIFHEDQFSKEKAQMLQTYAQARFAARMKIYKTEWETRTRKAFTPSDEQRLRKDEKAMADIRHEPYATELDVVAQVTSYYCIAAPRFHDAVCMRVKSKFFKQLCTQLRDELNNGLGIFNEVDGHDKAVALLVADPIREYARRELIDERNALLQGQKILEDLQNKNYGGDDADAARAMRDGSWDGTAYPFRGMHTPVSAGTEHEI